MTVVGFYDLNREEIRFDAMRKGKGDFGEMPRAILRALARQYREADHYGDAELFGGLPVVSMTTIVNPVRIARLKERHETFVDPYTNFWAAYGSIAHGMFEADAAGGDVVEHKLLVRLGDVWVAGTFDLLETAQEPGHFRGKDYKITSAYSVKEMLKGEVSWNGGKADYFWQGQGYKWMAEHPEVMQLIEEPDPGEALHGRIKMVKRMIEWPHRGALIDSWDLVAICRDWNKRRDSKTLPTQVSVVPVAPLLENHRIQNYLSQRTLIYDAAGMIDDNDLPACSDAEIWGYLPNGQGRRCSEWCEVANVCNQNRGNLGLPM